MGIDFGSTIAAISTPIGQNGIGVIRVSGKEAFPLIKRLIKTPPQTVLPRTMYLGQVVETNGKILDEVLFVFMKAPRSYTREDLLEIQCHGNYFTLKGILNICLEHGCVLAEAGEFTKRAFLNGRLDLTQADAVRQIINAKSELGSAVGTANLSGRVKQSLQRLKNKISEAKVSVEYAIDFDEEDLDENKWQSLSASLLPIENELSALIQNSERFMQVQNGLSIALYGRSNVGKSSLFNRLLEKERAIVSHLPGTTRDFIEDHLSFKGLPIKIVDTAGLRTSQNHIEKEGIKRSQAVCKDADVLVYLFDHEDRSVPKAVGELKKSVFVLNKCDLSSTYAIERALKKQSFDRPLFKLSAKTGQGVERLLNYLFKNYLSEQIDAKTPCLSNMRQLYDLRNASSVFVEIKALLQSKGPLDLLADKLNEAIDHLKRITGEIADEQIINDIFSKFCVGK